MTILSNDATPDPITPVLTRRWLSPRRPDDLTSSISWSGWPVSACRSAV